MASRTRRLGVPIQLVGANELIESFGKVTDGMKRRVLKRAVSKAAQVIVSPLRRASPKSKAGDKSRKNAEKNPPGTLRKSTGKVIRKYRGGNLQAAYVGHRWPKGAAAHLVERGHRNVRGKRGTEQTVHGQTPGRPFFKPVWQQNKGRAMDVLESELTHGLGKEVDKAVSRRMKRLGINQ